MFKKLITIALLASALTGCGTTPAAVAPATKAPGAIAAKDVGNKVSAADEKAATAIVTKELVPPGNEARMNVTDLKFQTTALAGVLSFTATRSENTIWAETRFYAVTGTVNLKTGAVKKTETLTKSVPFGH